MLLFQHFYVYFLLANKLNSIVKMLHKTVVITQSANFKESIEECYGDREAGDDFQYFYYHNLEFFSDFFILFNKCLFRDPFAVPGAVVGLGFA